METATSCHRNSSPLPINSPPSFIQSIGGYAMRSVIRRTFTGGGCFAVMGLAAVLAYAAEKHEGPPQPWSKYKVHDMERPAPPVVTPGTASTPEQPGKAPSDAVVLFDGTDLSHWQSDGGGEPTFKLE